MRYHIFEFGNVDFCQQLHHAFVGCTNDYDEAKKMAEKILENQTGSHNGVPNIYDAEEATVEFVDRKRHPEWPEIRTYINFWNKKKML